MRRFSIVALLAATLGLLALPDDAEARRWRRALRCAPVAHHCQPHYHQVHYTSHQTYPPCPSQHVAYGGYAARPYSAHPGYGYGNTGWRQSYSLTRPDYTHPEHTLVQSGHMPPTQSSIATIPYDSYRSRSSLYTSTAPRVASTQSNTLVQSGHVPPNRSVRATIPSDAYRSHSGRSTSASEGENDEPASTGQPAEEY